MKLRMVRIISVILMVGISLTGVYKYNEYKEINKETSVDFIINKGNNGRSIEVLDLSMLDIQIDREIMRELEKESDKYIKSKVNEEDVGKLLTSVEMVPDGVYVEVTGEDGIVEMRTSDVTDNSDVGDIIDSNLDSRYVVGNRVYGDNICITQYISEDGKFDVVVCSYSGGKYQCRSIEEFNGRINNQYSGIIESLISDIIDICSNKDINSVYFKSGSIDIIRGIGDVEVEDIIIGKSSVDLNYVDRIYMELVLRDKSIRIELKIGTDNKVEDVDII